MKKTMARERPPLPIALHQALDRLAKITGRKPVFAILAKGAKKP